MELHATIDVTSQSSAECLLQHFGRFGAPRQLRSDPGPHFIAEVIEQFLTLVGVEHELTLAYSKEENAIVERFNKEINRRFRALTFDNRLKISSSQMLFGNMQHLDRGIFLKHPERLTYKSLSGYMSKLLSMQDNLLKASAAELLRTDTLRLTTKELYEHTVYLPDTHVLVHYRTGSLL